MEDCPTQNGSAHALDFPAFEHRSSPKVRPKIFRIELKLAVSLFLSFIPFLLIELFVPLKYCTAHTIFASSCGASFKNSILLRIHLHSTVDHAIPPSSITSSSSSLTGSGSHRIFVSHGIIMPLDMPHPISWHNHATRHAASYIMELKIACH